MGNGEAGFYLCSMQACVSWVLQQREENFNAEIIEQKCASSPNIEADADIFPGSVEQNEIVNLPIVNYPSANDEAEALDKLERWMVGADMSEDTFEMLL